MERKLLSASELMERWGISRSTLFRGIRRGKFPAPIKAMQRKRLWKLHEIEAFEYRAK